MKHELIQSGKDFTYLKPLMDKVLEVRYTDLEKQFEICSSLLQTAENENYDYGKAFANIYLGDYYIAHNKGHIANEYLLKAKQLCENKDYTELIMNLNIFYGIYYDMMLDRLMSLNCTMEALDLATKLNNNQRKSSILNNVANMFETFGDFEAAKNYYYQAFNSMENLPDEEKNSATFALVIANLVHLNCYFKNLSEAQRFLNEFKYIDLSTPDNLGQQIVSSCHIAAAKKDFQTICEHIDRLEILLSKSELWRYQFFEIMLHISSMIITFKNEKYIFKVLTMLSKLTDVEDEGNQLREQRLWVQYYEMFGTDSQQAKAYRKYYQLKEVIDVTNNKTMAAGLHAKISLREAEKIQEEILKVSEKFENEAQYDELTQLYNRRSFVNFSNIIAEDLKVKSLSLVMIDIDYFKQFNDTYGHADGDVALVTVAECMKNAAQKNPNIFNFRYGGDEFLTMYKNCNEQDLQNFAEKLTDLVRAKAVAHCQSICSNYVSLSIGYHIIQRQNENNLDIVDLLAKADKALYWTKGQGRDGYSKFSEEMEIAWSKGQQN